MSKENFRFTIVPFKSHGFFWITFAGEITMPRLAKAHDAFTSHPDFVPGIDELLNFTNTSIRKTSNRDIDLVRQFMKEQKDRHQCKSVIVVNTQLEYGLSRMMGSNLDADAPVERAVFYTVREALEWLRPEMADELLRAYRKELRAAAG